MRGLLIAGGIALVVVVGVVFIVLEGRTLEKRTLTMRAVDSASGDSFELAPPDGYLLIEDERVQVPVGGIALGRESDQGRATIVIAPYPDDTDQLYTRAGCDAVAKLHAKQVGAQLVDARVLGSPGSRCLARIDEGPQFGGSMELRRVGPRSIMVTCRYPKDSAEDSDACAAAAGRLVPR